MSELLSLSSLNILSVPQLTVERFLSAASESLGLELQSGRQGLFRPILEPVLHRPGLALTGFYEHFAWRRLQVFGRAESSYLRMFGVKERLMRWEALLRRNVPAVILCGTDGDPVGGDLLELSDRLGIPVLSTRQESLVVFRQGALLLHELTAPCARMHGTLVEVGGVGVLLEGRPGVGKSETALGLMRHGHTLIADDTTQLTLDTHGSLRGTALDRFRGFIEIRGLGILHVETLFGISAEKADCRLDLIVSLFPCTNDQGIDREGSDVRTCEILGVPIPRMIIPVVVGRDLVNVVETAAATYKMRNSGVDAAAILDARIVAHNKTVEQNHE